MILALIFTFDYTVNHIHVCLGLVLQGLMLSHHFSIKYFIQFKGNRWYKTSASKNQHSLCQQGRTLSNWISVLWYFRSLTKTMTALIPFWLVKKEIQAVTDEIGNPGQKVSGFCPWCVYKDNITWIFPLISILLSQEFENTRETQRRRKSTHNSILWSISESVSLGDLPCKNGHTSSCLLFIPTISAQPAILWPFSFCLMSFPPFLCSQKFLPAPGKAPSERDKVTIS